MKSHEHVSIHYCHFGEQNTLNVPDKAILQSAALYSLIVKIVLYKTKEIC